jgi:outer membrane receptor protein involved in Fe transport
MLSKNFMYHLLLSSALVTVPVQAALAQEAAPVETTEGAAVDAASDAVGDAEVVDEAAVVQTIVVRGEFIPEPQQDTSQIATFLSSEDLARTGDDTAALALTRLSGLSVVSGKFAYVRGLGDRYSSARLNGSPLPSPEPLRRTVPLDLFPSNILDGAAVQKTFSADFPGEFGGGVIDLKTLRAPEDFFANVKASVGYNTATTGDNGLFLGGSDTDWSGYDDGLRDTPELLQAVLNQDLRLNSLSPRAVEAVGESLVNSPLSVIQSGDLGPSSEFSIDAGQLFSTDTFDIGLVGVVGYNQGWTTNRAIRQQVQGGILGNDIASTETVFDVTVNSLGSASISWGDNFIQSTGFYVHSTSKEAQIDTGRDFNAQGSTGQIFDESTGWFERELRFGQLLGEHEFGDLAFNWRGSLAQSTREAPYERALRRYVTATGVPLYSVANNYGIRFSDLTDDVAGLSGDLAYTSDLGDGREVRISGGLDYAKTEREYNFLALRFAGGNSLPLDVQSARPDFIFSPDNIDPARFVLQEITTTNDSYEASLDVRSGYLQAEADFTNFLQSTVGVRFEDAVQTVRTFDRFGNQGAGTVNLKNQYALPALTVTWNFAEDLQFRAGYSETIARPQFRELALSSYFDPESDRTYRGNSGLVDSKLQNYDARLEYYLGRNQFITVAGFAKQIENPIEEVQFSTSTFVFETTFINSPRAEVFGAEFEYRNRFDMPFDAQFFVDREWLFSANYTYTGSEVQASASDQVFDPISRGFRSASAFSLDGTQLQGTPENILNLQFGWESDVDQLTLLAGWVDQRVLQRGLRQAGASLPDVLEDPGIQLDLVYKRDVKLVGQDLTFSLSGRNLLDEQHREFQDDATLGETEFNTYDRGMSISAGVTAKF